MRDTATYPPFRKQLNAGSRPRRLQWLAKEFLSWEIQGDEHSPAEDAVAALRLYKLKMGEWERQLLSSPGGKGGKGGGGGGGLSRNGTFQTSGWEKALAKGKIQKKRRQQDGGRPKKIKRGTN